MSIRDLRFTLNGGTGASMGWLLLSWLGYPPGVWEFVIMAVGTFIVSTILTAPALSGK